MPFRSISPSLRIFGLVFLPVWALYLALISPTVTRGGDCGELIAASYSLGIGHPTGYPIWCLLGRLFALIPIGEIAGRYNFFSATCGAIATGFIALFVYNLTSVSIASPTSVQSSPQTLDKRAFWAALGSGWLLGGFYCFGTQALIGEVYALAALEGSLLLYVCLQWRQTHDWRWAFGLALLAGFSPIVHLSGVFLLPFLLLLAVWKRRFTPAKVALLVGFFVLGLSPAVYFPIRSAPFPLPQYDDLNESFYYPMDWGHPADFARLKNHMSGAQYRNLLVETSTKVVDGQTTTSRHLAQPVSKLPARLNEFFSFLLLQYLWATPLIIVGAIALWRRRIPRQGRIVAVALTAIWFFNIAVEINYKVPDQTNFFFPAYLVMAIWMGVGIWFMWPLINRKFAILGATLLVGTVAVQWDNFAIPASQHDVIRVRDAALEQAKAAQDLAQHSGKPVSIFFDSNDENWPFWYVKYALGVAPDVETPWGRRVQHLFEHGKGVDYVAQLKKRGPVVLAQWDEKVDQRFPFVMLSPSGNTALASDRALPPAAVPLSTPASIKTSTDPLLQARFRRAALWQANGADSGMYPNLPYLHPGTLAAFEADFRLDRAPATPLNHDYQAGTVEVVMAHAGYYGKNGPAADIENQKVDKDAPFYSYQSRRLIVAGNAQHDQLLRASVPLFVDIDFSVGPYEVWSRLHFNNEVPSPWIKSDAVYLTQK